ncbi:MAG: diphthine synthase [Candidatus Nezhaarchaeota archaeon]|nr:diphthine synthase [Candidatus Nezhaarchaeota archaeon]
MTLSLIGVGLTWLGITLEGLREAKEAEHVFLDSYTSLLPRDSLKALREIIGRHVVPLRRGDLEGEGMGRMVELARRDRVALLVVGDPFIATTHVALKLEAIKAGVTVKYVPSASIQSVIPGLTGLSSYKFGRSATVVFKHRGPSSSAYEALRDNMARGLHTLLYLDLDAESSKAMSIGEALELLLELEEARGERVVKSDTLIVGVARACWDNCLVKALKLADGLSYDFGPPPHVLIVPGSLHFMELEALKAFAGLEVEN